MSLSRPSTLSLRAARIQPQVLTSLHTSAVSLQKKQNTKEAAPLLHTWQLSPSAPLPSKKPYSAVTVSIVKGLAKLMGYNSTTSTAIRVTSDLYDRCAERAHAERNFWYGDCALPQSYQSWFQITNLHVYLMLVRFRALPSDAARAYSQELVNHFFIDAESRMRDRFGVQTSRLVKGYMRDMHMQHRGAILGLDEGLVGGDVRLAQAVWRNVWGAGWGTVAGVKRKLAGVDKTVEGEKEEGPPELAQDLAMLDPSLAKKSATSPYAKAAAAQRAAERAGAQTSTLADPKGHTAPSMIDMLPPVDPDAAANPEMAFPQHLHRVVKFIKSETHRLGNLSDREIQLGKVDTTKGSTAAFDRI